MTSSSKKFPGFDRLYDVGWPCDNGKNYFALLEKKVDDIPLMRGEWLPSEPLSLKYLTGPPEPGEVVSGGGLGIVFLAEKIFDLFRDYNLTGWSTYPVAMHNKAGELCKGYAGLSVTGRCGLKNENLGEYIADQHPETAKKYPRYRGIFFDESAWDGSDFCIPGDYGGSFYVTEAVKNVFEENRLNQLSFTPLTEAEWMRML